MVVISEKKFNVKHQCDHADSNNDEDKNKVMTVPNWMTFVFNDL
jgi:hypothetical protein